MKKTLAAIALVLASTTANAGNITYVAPENTMLEEPKPMGGSASWIIPLVIITVLLLTLTGDDDEQLVREQ